MMVLRWVRRILSLLVILVIAFPAYVTASIWWSGTHPSGKSADAIVVMGAAQYNGRPGAILTARLRHAKEIYDKGQAPRIITTGGRAPGDITTEADVGDRWLSVRGVKKVTAIAEGRDTYASTAAYVKFAKKEKITSVVIVTDPWHCHRAMVMARSLDIRASCSPSTSGPGVPATWKYFQREILASMAFTLLGPQHSLSSTKSLESLHG